jgi:hypothetical protein
MTAGSKRLLGKILEALGIAATMIALVTGVYGDAWGELYLFLGGIAVFLVGRQLEKQPA